MNESKEPTTAVLAVGRLNFEGHIIPHTWYEHITYTTDGGTEKVDLQAIIILSDIVYWYRPRTILDEATGKFLRYERRFSGDKLQRNYQQISDQFGLSKTQAARAVKRLRDLGLITMEFRTVETAKGPIPNVLYLEPVPERLAAITHERVRVSPQICQDTPSNLPTYPPENVRTNTENTSENTPKDNISRAEVEVRKPDILDAMLRFGTRSGDDYADPARDWDEAVDAFAGLVNVDPARLPDSARREWARVLREEVGAIWGVGASTVAEVIRAVPDSAVGWKTWSTPHQAKADLGTLVGQHLSGGIKGPKPKGNGKLSFSEQRKRFLEQAEKGATVDAPAWAVGEVL